MGPWFLHALACLAVLTCSAAPPARAQKQTPYVGVWALQLVDCGAAPEDDGAPMEIAED